MIHSLKRALGNLLSTVKDPEDCSGHDLAGLEMRCLETLVAALVPGDAREERESLPRRRKIVRQSLEIMHSRLERPLRPWSCARSWVSPTVCFDSPSMRRSDWVPWPIAASCGLTTSGLRSEKLLVVLSPFARLPGAADSTVWVPSRPSIISSSASFPPKHWAFVGEPAFSMRLGEPSKSLSHLDCRRPCSSHVARCQSDFSSRMLRQNGSPPPSRITLSFFRNLVSKPAV